MEKVGPRIGLFVCVQAGRFVETIDVHEIAGKFAKAKNVVRCEVVNDLWDSTFLDSVKNDVEEGQIDRILWVGRFTPYQVEQIKRELSAAGLNVYLQEWCDLDEQGIGNGATDLSVLKRKAESLVRMTLSRVRLLIPLEPVALPAVDALLIIGAGVAGIHAAETLVGLGKRVHLVERQSGVGGKVALLCRFYPRLCDPHCGLQFALDSLVQSDLAHFYTLTDVVSLEGSPGNFHVKLQKRPRCVIEQRCNACGLCAAVCPVEIPAGPTPGKWSVGPSGGPDRFPPPRAIHQAEPMPFPSAFVIERDFCPTGCNACEEACPTRAVELNQCTEEQIVQVGTVLVTTGWDPYPLARVGEFSYQQSASIVSNLEMERLLGDDRFGRGSPQEFLSADPKDVGFIQCAGSRDERHLPYCSSVCCSATLKQAVQIKERNPEANCYVFFIDVRSPGFDEDLYRQARNLGVVFIRELPSRVIVHPVTDNLELQVIDPSLNGPLQVNLDLLVLAGGMTPAEGTSDMARVLNLPQNSYGFFESHYQCHPEESQRTGIYVAGCAREPMKVSHAIESAHLAAMKALRFLQESILIEPAYPVVDKTKCDQCKRCVEQCPYSSFLFDEKSFPTPDLARCRQCGNCMGLCPLAVISLGNNTIKQMAARIGAFNPSFAGDKEPTVLAFLCENDAYKAARSAIDQGLPVPPNVIFVKVPCAGSVNNALVADALSKGIDGVIIAGCQENQCHHVSGSQLAQKRSGDLSDKLKAMIIEPQRVRFVALEIRDSEKYVDILTTHIEHLRAIGPNPFKI